MNFWFTSDTHFGHKNILKFNPETRPYASVEEMDESLIEHWNNTVASNDKVYHLGDFAFSNRERILEILNSLKGQITIVLGNHDQKLKQMMWQKDSDLPSHVRLLDYHEKRMPDPTHKGKGPFVCMSHYSFRVWNRSHHGSFMLYGHSHGSIPAYGRSMDVGIDQNDIPEYSGKLLPWEAIYQFLIDREIEMPDHHNAKTNI